MATLIDGTGCPPRPNQDVLLGEGRILQIGTSLPIPPGTQCLDLTEKFLTPG